MKRQNNGENDSGSENGSDGGDGIRRQMGSTSAAAAAYRHSNREIDVVEQCARAYAETPRPWRLGKMFACWYNRQGEPRIVVGPDVVFSLVEMGLVNGLMGMVLKSIRKQELWPVFFAGIALLLLHDFAFGATVMYN